jgi:hypothetical protein
MLVSTIIFGFTFFTHLTTCLSFPFIIPKEIVFEWESQNTRNMLLLTKSLTWLVFFSFVSV